MDGYKGIAVSLAKKAGEVMRANFILSANNQWKEVGSPLTVSDNTINNLVVQTIIKLLPDHSVLGEDGSLLQDGEYVWVLDPIDGTIPFTHGLPLSVFTLALTRYGAVVLAVIYDPFMNRLLVAEKDRGTTLNDKSVHVSKTNYLQNTLIEIESWRGDKINLNDLKGQLIAKGVQVTTMCTTAYAGLMVASGEYEGVLYTGRKPWDAAAVKLIVEEAGGKVTDLYGNEQRYDRDIKGIIASNDKLHNLLVDLVKPFL